MAYPNQPNQPNQPPAPAPPAPNTFENNLTQFNTNQDFKDTNVAQPQWDAWTAEERARQANGGKSAYNTQNKYSQSGGGCPPNLPYTSRPGPNGEVECSAKPDDCPEGMHVEGTPGKCVPNGQGHQAPGAFGGGGGSQGGGGGYGGSQWDNPIYKMLAERGKAGLSDPNKAMENYLGTGGQEAYSGRLDQARANIFAMPPGPARDYALAQLESGKAENLTSMGRDATQLAQQNAMGLTGLEQGYVQLGEQGRQADQSNATSRYGIDQNTGLGYAGLAQSGSQFGQQMDYNRWAQQGNWGQNDLDRRNQLQLSQMNIRANRPSGLQTGMQVLGTGAAVAGTIALIA